MKQENKEIFFYYLLLPSVASGVFGAMKWIQVDLGAFGYNEQYHLWSLVKLLNRLSHYTDAKELQTIIVITAIPMALWMVGLLGLLVSVGIRVCEDKSSGAINCLVASNILFLFSSGSFLVMLYGARHYLEQVVRDKIGFYVSADFVRPTAFPLIMTAVSVIGVMISILYKSNYRKENGGEERAGSTEENICGEEAVREALVLQEMNNRANVYACYLDEPVVVGRVSEGCNLVIPQEQSISRHHCQFLLLQGKCYVQDLNSRNHTYVNQAIVEDLAPLKKGDVLRLGQMELLVEECPESV